MLEADGGHAVRERNGFQAADAAERKVADVGDAVRDLYGFQAFSFKRTGSDFFDAPEHFIVPAFSGVLEQGHGAFFDQHIVVENIYGMVGGDLNGGQLGAVSESTFRDAGHAVRDADGFQAGAAAESKEINRGYAVRDGDVGQLGAVEERGAADGGYLVSVQFRGDHSVIAFAVNFCDFHCAVAFQRIFVHSARSG